MKNLFLLVAPLVLLAINVAQGEPTLFDLGFRLACIFVAGYGLFHGLVAALERVLER